MALNIDSIRSHLEAAKSVDRKDPEALLNAARVLLYTEHPLPTPPSTPPIDAESLLNLSDVADSKNQREHIHLITRLHLTAWDYLCQAEALCCNPQNWARVAMEKVLFLNRLYANKPIKCTVTPEAQSFVIAVLEEEHGVSKDKIEPLFQKVYSHGCVVAQLFSIRRLMELIGRPLAELHPKSMQAKKRECFASWLMSNSQYEDTLRCFSRDFSSILGERALFSNALEKLRVNYRSDTIEEYLKTQDEDGCVSRFLSENLPKLCKIDHEFQLNWNDVLFTRQPSLLKRLRTRGPAPELVRHHTAPPLFYQTTVPADSPSSLPAVEKPDEEGVRRQNPRKFIRQKPVVAESEQAAPAKPSRTK